MYNPKTAARSISPLAKPLTPAEYATLHVSARSRASWLLKNHAAQLEREVEAERAELTDLQETLEADLYQLRLAVKRRRHAMKLATARLENLGVEHDALKQAVDARRNRVAVLRGQLENAKRVRGMVTAAELARIEAEADEHLRNARGDLRAVRKEAAEYDRAHKGSVTRHLRSLKRPA